MRKATLLCLPVLAMTGCGGASRDSTKEFKGEDQAVAAVVERLEKAARADDANTVCTKLFTADRLAQLKEQGTTCTTAVKDAFKDADSFDLTVDKVTISGDTATAKVVSGRGSKEKTDTLTLKREGTWKVDALQA